MFKNLTKFGQKRTGKEAFGFYIAYVVLVVAVAFLAGGILGLTMGQDQAATVALRFGNILAIVVSVALSVAVIKAKKQTGNIGYLLLAVVSGILGLFGGVILGLIPVAYLTTK